MSTIKVSAKYRLIFQVMKEIFKETLNFVTFGKD